MTIRFFFDRAPNHVKNFVDLAASGFYDGTLFHRVIPGFVLQGGDPLTKDPKNAFVWGNAGKTDAKGHPVTLKPEFNETAHKRGIVSMARSSAPDSASSQFFIVLKDYPSLDHQYTAFGEVVKGMDVVDRIVAESNPDPANANLGRPRAYQKLVKVEIVEESAAPAAQPAPAPAPAKEGVTDLPEVEAIRRLGRARERFGLAGAPAPVPLAGDVGARRYFRQKTAGHSSTLLVLYPQPASAAQANWAAVGAALAAAGVRVPALHADAPDLGVALIEDLGDRDLAMDLAEAPLEDRPRLLDEAEELLLSVRSVSRAVAARNPAFDAGFFAAELDHTRHWALEKGGREPLGASRAADWQELARPSPARRPIPAPPVTPFRRIATTTRTTSCARPAASSRRSTFRICASGRRTTTRSRCASKGPPKPSRATPRRTPSRSSFRGPGRFSGRSRR